MSIHPTAPQSYIFGLLSLNVVVSQWFGFLVDWSIQNLWCISIHAKLDAQTPCCSQWKSRGYNLLAQELYYLTVLDFLILKCEKLQAFQLLGQVHCLQCSKLLFGSINCSSLSLQDLQECPHFRMLGCRVHFEYRAGWTKSISARAALKQTTMAIIIVTRPPRVVLKSDCPRKFRAIGLPNMSLFCSSFPS